MRQAAHVHAQAEVGEVVDDAYGPIGVGMLELGARVLAVGPCALVHQLHRAPIALQLGGQVGARELAALTRLLIIRSRPAVEKVLQLNAIHAVRCPITLIKYININKFVEISCLSVRAEQQVHTFSSASCATHMRARSKHVPAWTRGRSWPSLAFSANRLSPPRRWSEACLVGEP